MITGSADIVQSDQIKLAADNGDWQQLLARSVSSPRLLLQRLKLSARLLPQLDEAALDFPLRVPLPFVDRMKAATPNDPLLLQVLPLREERVQRAGYSTDPLLENQTRHTPGIIHKYQGRVLLVTTGACAVHCRYCFRRHFPYQQHQQTPARISQSLDYIRRDSSISEVILSGGDPLVLGNDRLADILKQLAGIPQLRRLRIHTRLPVVLPQRIDRRLLELLESSRLQCAVVIHSNHPAELDDGVHQSLRALRQIGATLLNQSVLLRNINDDADVLCELSETLMSMGALPYYLHLLDPVAGSAHFDVNQVTAQRIYGELLQRLPGYLVPRLVRETPSSTHKTPIAPL